MQETYDLHKFLYTDAIQKDVVSFLTNRVSQAPLSGKNGKVEDPLQWNNHLMESILKDRLKKEEYLKNQQEEYQNHLNNNFLNLQSLNTD